MADFWLWLIPKTKVGFVGSQCTCLYVCDSQSINHYFIMSWKLTRELAKLVCRTDNWQPTFFCVYFCASVCYILWHSRTVRAAGVNNLWHRKLDDLTKLCDDKNEEFKQLEHQDTRMREDLKHAHSQSKKLEKSLAQEQKKVLPVWCVLYCIVSQYAFSFIFSLGRMSSSSADFRLQRHACGSTLLGKNSQFL